MKSKQHGDGESGVIKGFLICIIRKILFAWSYQEECDDIQHEHVR
jgi:hypothetical protein